MEKVIKFSVLLLFFIIFFNTKNVYGLSEKEVRELKVGDKIEITKSSKIYTYGYRWVAGAELYDVHELEGYETKRIPVGTKLEVMKSVEPGKCYKRQGDTYYISVNWDKVDCFVHYSNLKKVKSTEEDKQKVENFLDKKNVKKIKEGNAKELSDDELTEIAKESRKIFLETADDEVSQIEHKALAELYSRGYTTSNNEDGSMDIINSNGKKVDSMSGGDTDTVSNSEIYSRPEKKDQKDASSNLDDMISDADKFIGNGNLTYNADDLSNVSNTIFNILVTVGIIIAVLMGAILGIKLMISGVEEKAQVKKLLMPYVVGCIIIFGGFGIWKLVVTILQGV